MVSFYATTAAVAAALLSVSDAQSVIGAYFRPWPQFTSGAPGNTTAPYRRAPCPAINTLANHGVIPRNGINVTKAELRDAVKVQFNLDPALADAIVSALPDVFDLNLLGTHGFIEHDTSLVHADAYFGHDPSQVDATLLEDMLSRASPSQPFDIATIGKIRKDRAAACFAHNPNCTFGAKESRPSFSEAAVVLLRFGDATSETASLAHVESFLKLESFPVDWKTPATVLTTAQFQVTQAKIIAASA
jgi:hypothetical protein